jgi:hypothetical protein
MDMDRPSIFDLTYLGPPYENAFLRILQWPFERNRKKN